MFCKKVFLSGIIMIIAGLLQPLSARAGELTAKAAIVVDLNRNTVVFERAPTARYPIASTVKIFTAIIAADELKLTDKVTISKRAAGIAPSKAYLSENSEYSVKDLLKCFLMSSANDAGVALAEAVSGTEIKFSSFMNERSREMGAKNSFFLNATGLPEGKKRQYSTAKDLALFMKKFLSYPFLVEILKTKEAVVSGSDAKEIRLRNHNKFLWRDSHDLVGKTGYTRRAGHCFVGTFSKGKRRFVIVILGSRKPWDDLALLMDKKY